MSSVEACSEYEQFIAEFAGDDLLLLANDREIAESLQPLVGQLEYKNLTDISADLALLGERRWPQVCVLDPQIDGVALSKLLARLRDLHTDRVLHIDQGSQWSLADSLALGFSRLVAGDCRNSNRGGFSVYRFDLHSYKQAPDWLNARNWANPELWDKHRW